MDDSSLQQLAAKAGLVWIQTDSANQPCWFVWHDGAIHLVVGGGEQPDPFGSLPATVSLTVPSKETRAAVLTVSAEAHALPPGTAAWLAAAAGLAANRLNASPGDLAERWATDSRIVRLTATETGHPTSDDDGVAGQISVEPVRPRRWRAMRAHARTPDGTRANPAASRPGSRGGQRADG